MDVDPLLVVVAVLVVLYLVVRAGMKGSRRASGGHAAVEPQNSEELGSDLIDPAVLRLNQPWLEQRWKAAEGAKEAGDHSIYPAWFFDPITDRQRERLLKMGVPLRGIVLTKGQASDLIGLGEEPEDHDLEQLKFFKVPTRGLNQTRARAELARLLSAPENKLKWENRPASAEQKDCIKFFGRSVSAGLKHTEAESLIAELNDEHPQLADDWDDLESIIDEFNDKDAREDLEIKKPSKKVLLECIELLRGEGRKLEELALDTEIVADKLKELHPELERQVDY